MGKLSKKATSYKMTKLKNALEEVLTVMKESEGNDEAKDGQMKK